jgi:hypothetical protein
VEMSVYVGGMNWVKRNQSISESIWNNYLYFSKALSQYTFCQ